MNKVRRVVAASMVAMVLSACGTSGGVGGVDGGAQTISGQVADYTGPAGTLEAKDDANETVVGAGSIKADGSFTLELIEPAPELLSSLIIYTAECPDLSISDRDAQGLFVTEISVMANGKRVGYIAQSSMDVDTESFSSTSVTRIYADRDATLKGACTSSGTDGVNIITYDLDYKRGWNIRLVEIKSRPNISGILSENSTVSAVEVENVEWVYSSDAN